MSKKYFSEHDILHLELDLSKRQYLLYSGLNYREIGFRFGEKTRKRSLKELEVIIKRKKKIYELLVNKFSNEKSEDLFHLIWFYLSHETLFDRVWLKHYWENKAQNQSMIIKHAARIHQRSNINDLGVYSFTEQEIYQGIKRIQEVMNKNGLTFKELDIKSIYSEIE